MDAIVFSGLITAYFDFYFDCRYPMVDLPNFPFPNSVPLFCLPMGATLELWPVEATRPKPVFSTFVLTVSDAKHKVYGSAVTFYEKFPQENLTDEQRELLDYSDDSKFVLNVNKSVCVLSHWPFSEDFETWLRWLHVRGNVAFNIGIRKVDSNYYFRRSWRAENLSLSP